MAERSEVVVVAPVFFSVGNIEMLTVALESARRGRPVIFRDAATTAERDLTGGQAVSLVEEALAAGATTVEDAGQAVEMLREIAATQPR
jgi:hypothetical protein